MTVPQRLPSGGAIGADELTRALSPSFFARPAEQVAPELVGCLLVHGGEGEEPLWGVVVETEAYSQAEPACHGHRRRSASNETLFGPPGHFYVYVSHGVHHCVNVVTDRADWANGVLLRAVSVPGDSDRRAAGPGLLARHFGIDRSHDARPAVPPSGLWLAPRPAAVAELLHRLEAEEGPPALVRTERIGIRSGRELPWRWYLRASRDVSRRCPGDRRPRHDRLAALLSTPSLGS
jgi:DNA-3-methyladenine glycosylase